MSKLKVKRQAKQKRQEIALNVLYVLATILMLIIALLPAIAQL